ncbi:MAG: class I tRNA ligase family protein, partial [Proteobacteria bacterium]|nr:class I tRNA ligase family protein [Pseudomonadota bacterium]
GKFDDLSDQGRAVRHETFEALVLVLNPITPHVCHALWQALGHRESLIDVPWPKVDPAALAKSDVTLAVQVNGKLRGTIDVPVDASRDVVENAALALAEVAKFVGSAVPKKIVIVPGKIVNVVV